jgi:hypothetical protein
LWFVAIAVSVLLQWRWLALLDDVRGSIGSLRVGEAGGLSPVDIFIHRPMANRILMSGLDRLTFGPIVLREQLTLALAMVVAGIVAACLARSLRSWVGRFGGTSVGLAIFAALAWAPGTTVLQPEWVAVLLCVAALALALGGNDADRPRWHSPWMWGAGTLFALAALQKYTTATTVLLALGIVLVVSRRRAVVVAGWTVVVAITLFALTMMHPHERVWFTEMPRLQPGAVQWSGFGTGTWRALWVNPILLLWPAASVYGSAVGRRRAWLWGPSLAVLVTLAGVAVQQRFYPYHYTELVVLIAGLVALAAAAWWQQTGRLPHAVVLVAAVWLPMAAWMGRQTFAWRTEHLDYAAVGVLATAVLSAVLAGVEVQRARALTVQPRRGLGVLPVAVALALVVSFPAWPHTPWAYNWLDTTRTSELSYRAAMSADGEEIRAAAGRSSVAYMTLQDGPYFVGLPATCPYPLAAFLYRSLGAQAGDMVGFRENLECLRDPAATFLVLQGRSAGRGRALPIVRTTIGEEFDCKHPVARTRTYVLCPRR